MKISTNPLECGGLAQTRTADLLRVKQRLTENNGRYSAPNTVETRTNRPHLRVIDGILGARKGIA